MFSEHIKSKAEKDKGDTILIPYKRVEPKPFCFCPHILDPEYFQNHAKKPNVTAGKT